MVSVAKFHKKLMPVIFCLLCYQSIAADWKQQSSGTLAWLRSIYFVDSNRGWIAGSKGTLLVTADGGASWQKSKRFTDDNIWDVYFSDAKNGWLLCESDIYAGASPHSYLLFTSDGGQTWERADFKDSRDRVIRFFFTKEGHGFGVGEGGAIWQMLGDKKNWTRRELPHRFLVLDGTFTDTFNGILVGGGGKILISSDGGFEWSDASILEANGIRLNSVFFVDQTTGWVVGAKGKIFVSTNGGKIWREQASGINETLSDVVFLNPRVGYAVGENGRVIETRNAGSTWTVAETGVRGKLERIVFVGDKGFAIGFGGLILTN